MEASPERRQEYLEILKTIEKESLVYIDESGINKALVKEYGWAKKGEKLFGKKTGNRFNRTNIIAALNCKKPIAPMVFNGSCDTKIFNCWVEKVLLKELKPNQVVILDNASFHKSEKTRSLIESVGCKILYLPPYSPDLNPIERFWAKFKKALQKIMITVLNIFDAISEYFSSQAYLN